MLGSNLPQLLRIVAAVEDDEARAVEIDAADLITAEPVALCILALTLARLKRRGQSAIVRNVDPRVKESLEKMDVLAPWLHAAEIAEHCRDLCLLAGGRIEAVSGRGWVTNPGCESAGRSILEDGHQGAILNLEFHRRSITPSSIGEILRRYQPDEGLPIRFF